MATKKGKKPELDVALKTLDLVQELVWAIRSRDSSELLDGVVHLRNLAESEKAKRRASQDASLLLHDKRAYLRELVGSMSLLLADSELFPANEDIAKFATEALQISITRWEKRSRYEMIGMLIMESINANPNRVRGVGALLDRIIAGPDAMIQIKSRSRQTGFSWNEAIRSLSTDVE